MPKIHQSRGTQRPIQQSPNQPLKKEHWSDSMNKSLDNNKQTEKRIADITTRTPAASTADKPLTYSPPKANIGLGPTGQPTVEYKHVMPAKAPNNNVQPRASTADKPVTYSHPQPRVSMGPSGPTVEYRPVTETTEVKEKNVQPSASQPSPGVKQLFQDALAGNAVAIKNYSLDTLRAKDQDGNTALHIAAKHGHLEVVKAIYQRQVPDDTLQSTNNQGETALHLSTLSSLQEQYKVSEYLLDNRIIPVESYMSYGNSGMNCLHNLISRQRFDLIEKFIVPQCSSNTELLNRVDWHDRTPLQYAMENHAPDSTIQSLLNATAD
jgi:hypothetical protein